MPGREEDLPLGDQAPREFARPDAPSRPTATTTSASALAPPDHSIIPLPRSLVFGTTAWLIVSWALTVGFGRPIQASSNAYEPGVQLMLGSLMAGLMVAWPMLRLSQPASRAPGRQTLMDLFVLLAMIQVITWPLRLVTRWTVERTMAIDAVFIGWVVLTGAVVAAAIGSARRGPRVLAMFVLLGLALGGPVLWLVEASAWLAEPTFLGRLARLSPFMVTHHLGDGAGAPVRIEDWQLVGLLWFAGLAAWVGYGLSRLGRGRPESPPAVAQRL